MANKTIEEYRKPAGMSDADWMKELATKTAAQHKAAGRVFTQTIKCCDDVGCPDHDPDAIAVRQLRDKALKGALTAADLTQHNQAEIRCKAKGISL